MGSVAAPDRGARGVLFYSGLVAMVAGFWWAVNVVHPVGPLVLLWLPACVNAGLMTVTFVRVGRTSSLPTPARRFWGRLSIASALVFAATVTQVVRVAIDPGASGLRAGPAMYLLDACLVVVVVALCLVPLGDQSPGERLRIGLDAGTVVLATAAFMWRFQTSAAVRCCDTAAVPAALMLTVTGMVAVFGMLKIVLSQHAVIDPAALWRLAPAMVAGVVGALFEPLVATLQTGLFTDQIEMPIGFLVATWAAERQRTAAARPVPTRGVGPRRRLLSQLPYAAVAAVDALLITVTWRADSGVRVIVGIAVLLTGLVVIRQVTALRDNRQLVAQLDHSATHDSLTGLPNRALFERKLRTALAAPDGHPVAVALIDLDGFKGVNDTLGHEAGDRLLVAVAQRLRQESHGEDTVARLGGDEFVIVWDGADSAAVATAAERMTTALTGFVVPYQGRQLLVQASIGLTEGHSGDDPDTLLRQADIAMYAAKNVAGTACLDFTALVGAGNA